LDKLIVQIKYSYNSIQFVIIYRTKIQLIPNLNSNFTNENSYHREKLKLETKITNSEQRTTDVKSSIHVV